MAPPWVKMAVDVPSAGLLLLMLDPPAGLLLLMLEPPLDPIAPAGKLGCPGLGLRTTAIAASISSIFPLYRVRILWLWPCCSMKS